MDWHYPFVHICRALYSNRGAQKFSNERKAKGIRDFAASSRATCCLLGVTVAVRSQSTHLICSNDNMCIALCVSARMCQR